MALSITRNGRGKMRNEKTDKVEFTVKLLCTMEFHGGAEQFMDSPEDIEEFLNEMRNEIRDCLTSYGMGNSRTMYFPKEFHSTYGTPTILDCIELDAETGVFTER